MPTSQPSQAERIQTLERQLRDTNATLQQISRRLALTTPPQQIFWAQTWSESEGDYPESDANKLPIVPLDRDWLKEAGAETSADERQTESPIGIAYADRHYERESNVLCFRDYPAMRTYVIPTPADSIIRIYADTNGIYSGWSYRNVPPYGVVRQWTQAGARGIQTIGGVKYYRVGQPKGPEHDTVLYLNGSASIEPTETGIGYTAFREPTFARLPSWFDPDVDTINAGEQWGALWLTDMSVASHTLPESDAFAIWRGIPGFRICGAPEAFTDWNEETRYRVQVLRDFSADSCAVAKYNWTDGHYVDCYLSANWNQVGAEYDGDSTKNASVPRFPASVVRVNLDTSDWTQTPNVEAGNPIIYRQYIRSWLSNQSHLYAVNDVYDAPVGTVRVRAYNLPAGTPAVPQGWARMDGVANYAGTGLNMQGRFPRAWKTDNTLGSLGDVDVESLAAGEDFDLPWMLLDFIERIDNSIPSA